MDGSVTIAYDVKLKRPGCVLVQRTAGATISTEDLHLLDGWLPAPTPDMHLLIISDREQFEKVILMTNGEKS